MSHLLVQRTESLAILQLNRPEKHNALSRQVIEELTTLFAELSADQDLRTIILTGAGEKAFCAGTDIGELSEKSEAEAVALSKRGQQLCDQIETSPVPVIAAINGIAAGGGCELALACHLRIASTTASFSLPETKLGVIPGYGGTQRLVREIGHGRALELILTGQSLPAEQAYDFGLVNRVVQPTELLESAQKLAAEIAKLSPLSIRACLQAVTQGSELPLNEGLALETKLFASLFATEDAKEGARAFLEKRPPIFKGR